MVRHVGFLADSGHLPNTRDEYYLERERLNRENVNYPPRVLHRVGALVVARADKVKQNTVDDGVDAHDDYEKVDYGEEYFAFVALYVIILSKKRLLLERHIN